MSRDAKQEALDFLEALEGDATLTPPPSNPPNPRTGGGQPAFKAFNSSIPPPSQSQSPPIPSTKTTATTATRVSPYRPPGASPSVPPPTNPTGFGGAKQPFVGAPPITAASNPGTAPFKPTSKQVFHTAGAPSATINVVPIVAKPSSVNAGLQNMSIQQPNQQPAPPPVSGGNILQGQAQPPPSSKRVHAFIPGMKPASSTPPPQVPSFNPNTPASFPVGEPVDQSSYPTESTQSGTQNQQHQQNQQNDQHQEEDSTWSWGTSLWSTAQKGLESAKTIAGTAAQTIQQSETVKGLVKNYKPELEKLGNAIAPSLSTSGDLGNSFKFPHGLTVWLCLSLPPSLVGERVLRMAKQSMREWWNGHIVADHPGATVNFVDDTNSTTCTTVHQAVFKAEETMEKLQKLANGHVGDMKHVLFVIQPFNTTIQSTILESADHVQFYCSLVCDAPSSTASPHPPTSTLIHASCVSQSVALGGGFDEDWRSEMYSRVLETAVSDLVEEFSTKASRIN